MPNDNWGDDLLGRAIGGVNEMFSRLWIVVIFIVIVALIAFCIGSLTGIPPIIVVGLMVAFLVIVVGSTIVSAIKSERRRVAPVKKQCTFIRGHGKKCTMAKVPGSDYCELHEKRVKSVVVKQVKIKRSQCGFIRGDGTKCKVLKPVDQIRCNHHLADVSS